MAYSPIKTNSTADILPGQEPGFTGGGRHSASSNARGEGNRAYGNNYSDFRTPTKKAANTDLQSTRSHSVASTPGRGTAQPLSSAQTGKSRGAAR